MPPSPGRNQFAELVLRCEGSRCGSSGLRRWGAAFGAGPLSAGARGVGQVPVPHWGTGGVGLGGRGDRYFEIIANLYLYRVSKKGKC